MIYLDWAKAGDSGGGGGTGPVPVIGWDTSIGNSGTIAFSNDDRTATFSVSGFGVNGCRTLMGHTSGKRYAEVAYNYNNTFGPSVRNTIGVTASAMIPSDVGDDNNNGLGVRSFRYVFQVTSSLGQLDGPGVNPGILRIAYDADTGDLWFALNGSSWGGGSFPVGDPETGSNPLVTLSDPSQMHYIFANFESSFSPNHVVTLHEQDADMAYAIPTGFLSWVNL